MRYKLLFLWCLLVFLESKAQDFQPLFEPGAEYTLILNDGIKITGTVMQFADGVVTLRNSSGDFRVNVRDIRRIKGGPEKKSESNEEWFATPKKGNYVLGPSGIPLEPNEFNYQNNYLIINTLNYGITNAVSIGGGFELISAALGYPIYYLNPRIAIPAGNNLHVGSGILFISAPSLDIISATNVDVEKYYDLGVLYGSATLGNSDRNVTLIAGYGLLNSKPTRRPTISIGAAYRLISSLSVITENWLIPEAYILSYGLRLMTRRVAFDFAFINHHEFYSSDTFGFGIPFISFNIKLGKVRNEP